MHFLVEFYSILLLFPRGRKPLDGIATDPCSDKVYQNTFFAGNPTLSFFNEAPREPANDDIRIVIATYTLMGTLGFARGMYMSLSTRNISDPLCKSSPMSDASSIRIR